MAAIVAGLAFATAVLVVVTVCIIYFLRMVMNEHTATNQQIRAHNERVWEENGRRLDIAITILDGCIGKSTDTYLKSLSQLSEPNSIATLARVKAEAQSRERTSGDIDKISEGLHTMRTGNRRPVNHGQTTIPFPTPPAPPEG